LGGLELDQGFRLSMVRDFLYPRGKERGKKRKGKKEKGEREKRQKGRS